MSSEAHFKAKILLYFGKKNVLICDNVLYFFSPEHQHNSLCYVMPNSQMKNTVMHQEIALTWYQTPGCLETLSESLTFHLGVWHCMDTANGKQTSWQSIH